MTKIEITRPRILGEKQLEWLRTNIPGFKINEVQANNKLESEATYRREYHN